jgi:3-dehydroquinate dehydratase-2
MQKILLVNGPNLNRLGKREPHLYGSKTLADIESACHQRSMSLGYELLTCQSNHEGVLIDFIQANQDEAVGMVINPAGYGHTSVALRDAVIGSHLLCVEVHLSNTSKREAFRHKTLITDVVSGCIMGLGAFGYELAILSIDQQLKEKI